MNKNNILILSSKLDQNENANIGYYENDHFNANQIIFFNLETDSITALELTKPVYQIQSCDFNNNNFWISSFDYSGGNRYRIFSKIDLLGNVSEINFTKELHGSVRIVKSYKNKLFILSDSVLLYLPQKDTLEKVHDLILARNSIYKETDNSIFIISSNYRTHKKIYYPKIDLKDIL